MNRLAIALLHLKSMLIKLDVEWAVVGGLAVSARSEPRTTRDVDVTVAVENDAEAEQIVRELWSRGFQMLTPPLEHLDVSRMATARLLMASQEVRGIVVDLLFASSGIEPELVAAAQEMEVLHGVTVPVATTGHLLALKVLAGRPQDITDIGTLLRFSSESDLRQARKALVLISRRGYDRGKDLLEQFENEIDRSRGYG